MSGLVRWKVERYRYGSRKWTTPGITDGHVSPREDGWYLPEVSVDVRALMHGLVKACKHREVHAATGAAAVEVVVDRGRATGVKTEKSEFAAGLVVNCAGA